MQSGRRPGSCGVVAQLPGQNPLQKIHRGGRRRVVVLQKMHRRDIDGGHPTTAHPARVPAPERRAREAPIARRRGAPPSEPARPLEDGAPDPRRLLDDGGLGRRRPTTDRWAGFGCTVKVRIHADTGDRNRTGTCCTLCSGTEADTYKRTRLVKINRRLLFRVLVRSALPQCCQQILHSSAGMSKIRHPLAALKNAFSDKCQKISRAVISNCVSEYF